MTGEAVEAKAVMEPDGELPQLAALRTKAKRVSDIQVGGTSGASLHRDTALVLSGGRLRGLALHAAALHAHLGELVCLR